MTGLRMTRRDALKTASALAVLPSVSGLFHSVAAQSAPEQWTGYTICDHCNHMPMCGIKFDAVGNHVIGIHNWNEHRQKFLCSKGIATLQRLYNPNRLLYPLKRTNPKGSADPGWVRCSWDEALKSIAAKLTEVRSKYGAESVLFFAGDPKEPRPPLMRLARYFGSPCYANESSTACNKGTVLSAELTVGQECNGGPNPKAKCIAIIGTNKSWSAPHGFTRGIAGARAKGSKLLVIDPRRTPLAQIADLHLQLKQGTDAALALAMCRIIIHEGLTDKEFIEKWVVGFDAFKKACEPWTPQKAAGVTGVPADDIVKAAHMWADGPSTFALSSQSISHSCNGVSGNRAYYCLAAICGFIDRPGTIAFNNWPHDYVRWDDGYTKGFYDEAWWLKPEQKARRFDKKFAPVWHETQIFMSANNLPEVVKEGKIHAFVGFGFNVMIWPSWLEYEHAIRKLDFSFATDYFYRDESHHDMDFVLPAAMNFERYAPFAVHGNVVSVRKPVKPLGEAWEDWKIALTIGSMIDTPEHFFDGDPVKACDSILKDWGLSYGACQEKLPQPVPTKYFPKGQFEKYAKGLLREDGKPGFRTPSGKIELDSSIIRKHFKVGVPQFKAPIAPTKQYPLKLINGTRKPYMTHSKTREDAPYLLELEPWSTVDMNPEDAKARGIKEGDFVQITSPHSKRVVMARACVTILVQKGLIGMQYGWRGNMETQCLIPRNHWDPISGYGPYNETCVQIRKAPEGVLPVRHEPVL